jgi:peptidoglycan/xylan/chitin deacetylase (PgdA/CDA1 family)
MKKEILIFLLLAVVIVTGICVKTKSSPAYSRQTQAGNVETENQTIQEPKKVALTFDDGPNPVYTPLVLDGLKQREVKATFFLIGSEAELYPELVERIYEEGHLIGNHSYHHSQLSVLSESEIRSELDQTNEVITKITGECPTVFRPPFGSLEKNMEMKFDMLEVLWDIDPLDWCTCDASVVAARVLKKAADNQIILLHDASQSSVDAAFQIIDTLQQQGYEFVTVEELILGF